MKIKKIRAYPVTIPLAAHYVHAHGPVTGFGNAIVEVNTDEGVTGYGESDLIDGVTSEPLTTIPEVVDRYLAADIIGMDPFDIEKILDVMDKRVRGNHSAKTGIEYALWDLKGKYLKQPVYNLLGGKYAERIEVDYTISMDTPKKMADMAKKMMAYRYKTFVVKVGINSEFDVARLKSVREAVGPEIKLRLDANEAYTAEKAIAMIKRFERYDPELVEQPVARWDVKGIAKVARAVDTPISADEGNSSLHQALELIESQAVDVLNIKPPYHGGLWNSKKIAAIAQAAGIPIIVGGMTHFEVGRQANRHFAISTKMANVGYSHEGPGPASQSLVDNVTKNVISYDDVKGWDGFVELPPTPGLGVEMDMAKVKRFQSV